MFLASKNEVLTFNFLLDHIKKYMFLSFALKAVEHNYLIHYDYYA